MSTPRKHNCEASRNTSGIERVTPIHWPIAYRGETALLLFRNLHRYTLYGAILLLVFLWWEGFAAFFRQGRLGIGVGTVVMLVNAALLTGYAFGCRSRAT
jgi:hypothetical protein